MTVKADFSKALNEAHLVTTGMDGEQLSKQFRELSKSDWIGVFHWDQMASMENAGLIYKKVKYNASDLLKSEDLDDWLERMTAKAIHYTGRGRLIGSDSRVPESSGYESWISGDIAVNVGWNVWARVCGFTVVCPMTSRNRVEQKVRPLFNYLDGCYRVDLDSEYEEGVPGLKKRLKKLFPPTE